VQGRRCGSVRTINSVQQISAHVAAVLGNEIRKTMSVTEEVCSVTVLCACVYLLSHPAYTNCVPSRGSCIIQIGEISNYAGRNEQCL